MLFKEAKDWGPYVWYFMHQLTFRLPQNNIPFDKRILKKLNNFLVLIKNLLPCKSCQEHYSNTLTKYPPLKYITTGIGLAKWVVLAHNLTNKGLKKKEIPYPTTVGMYTNESGIHYILNHSKLSTFINIILVKSKNKPLKSRKKIAETVALLYPCLKCREKFKPYLSNNYIKSIKTNTEMKSLAKKFLDISKIPCV
jgi:hypothetical protein